jgi:DNA-binding GntR family transcriptional regulator
MRAPSIEDGYRALAEHRGLAQAIASRDAERARAVMLKVLGDFPAEMKRSLEANP